jgi:uncharacterized protein (DUF433 family)
LASRANCGLDAEPGANGMTIDEIVCELPDLEPDDIPAALRYAAVAVRDDERPLGLPA